MRVYFFMVYAILWLSNFAQNDSLPLHFLPLEKKFEFRLDSNIKIIFDKNQTETSCKLNARVDTLSCFKSPMNDSVVIRINDYDITIYKLYIHENDILEIKRPSEFVRITVNYGKKVLVEKIQNEKFLTIIEFDKKGRCIYMKTGELFNYRFRIINEKEFYKNGKIKRNYKRINGNDCTSEYYNRRGVYKKSFGGNYF